MKISATRILYILLISTAISSCSKFQKVMKSSDFNLKYDKAVEYYEKKDYYRAVSLFEDIENIFKASEKGQKIQYYMSYCYYNQGNHILAGHYFLNFAGRFPNNEHSEECEYMAAYCSALLSPEPSLDQTYTRQAIDEMQAFVNKYPNSTRISECNRIIGKLRYKLETKSFEAARLYFNIGDYKAATISFKNNLEEFPDSPFRENVRFLMLKSWYLYAQKSILSKQPERFQNTINEYYALIAEYPETQYLKEAQKIFADATEKITKK
ncbi:MAG: outer membrane protein assembly factor BamD [Bacteroidetes bacterium HGW-Bacteroidetes-21]|nr:MAG: outer membrane protein assembly factor BamD [Bacteroidetes bacterium HGW-Bacteroidetes-21]